MPYGADMTAKYPRSNERSASTTWKHEPDRIRRRPPGGPNKASAQQAFSGLARRNPRDAITITERYRGGAEGWWLVEARGRRQAFPGVLDLHTVMTVVNQSWSAPRRRT